MKKNLLINSPAKEFAHFIEPMLFGLSKKWNIYFVINNNNSSPTNDLRRKLRNNYLNKIIKSYFVVTKNHYDRNLSNLYSFHKNLNKIAKKIAKLNISYYMTLDGVETFDKYITYYLPQDVKIILLGKYISNYYFERKENEVKKILYDNYNIKINDNEKIENYNNNLNNNLSNNNSKLYKLFKKIKEKKINDYFYYFKSVIFEINYNRLYNFLDRVIFPYFLLKTIFVTNQYDNDSQIGSNFDLLIVFDQYEEFVFKKIFKNRKIYLAKHPASGSCFCNKIKRKNKPVLSPISTFSRVEQLPEYYSKVYLRDTLNALKELNTNEIHFRHHPSFKSKWIYKFMNLLNQNNIKTKLVSSQMPLSKIICNYRAIIGLASGALRDARASCENCIVVGFEAPSHFRYKNPRFVFGKSDGIGWINAQGNYNKKIFNRKKYKYLSKKSIFDILNNYIFNEIDY